MIKVHSRIFQNLFQAPALRQPLSSLRGVGAGLCAISACISTSMVIENVQAATMEEINIIGSRAPGRSAQDLPVPVDTISSEALSSTGQTELGRMLQTLAPSFNFSSSSISDGTDALRPATLRGLGPDQTLVLINGKRRHQASLIHINTSVGRGTAGTDLNAIPAAAIKDIQILRDGAAAQYGSDAIAGVINIILHDAPEGAHIGASYGEYSKGDGETTNINVRRGFALGSNGFVNATLNFRDRGFTNRAGLHGSCQFPGCVDTGNTIDGNKIFETSNVRELNAPRNTFRIGDAESEQVAFMLNSAIDFAEGELYGFVTYSNRDSESAAFFRHNANAGGNAPLADGDATIPAGFLPKINSEIRDLSFNFGYKVDFDNGSTLDLSYTDGRNTIDYNTSDSINSSFANRQQNETTLSSDEIRATVPREADAYGLELGLETINLDFTQEIGDVFYAMGVELRTDEYKIIPGEEYAYRDYDTDEFGVAEYADDRSGGIQGFPGIGPDNAVDETRDVFSVYVDGEYQFTDAVMGSAAVRYDDYDGFGDTLNFKVAGKFDVSDAIGFRAAVSTGFRAPSMQQLYFNNVSTQFIDDPDPASPSGSPQVFATVGTFRNDSTLAQAIGIPELKEEESTNYSFGVVTNLLDNLDITIDVYKIDIEDRIVISNQLGMFIDPVLDAALMQAGADVGQFFLNGADTETKGVDIVASYGGIELGGGMVDVSLIANFTDTEVEKVFTPAGSALTQVAVSDVFSAQAISIIEEWQPKDRVTLSANYNVNALSVNLALNRFGEYTITDSGRQTYGAELLTDLRVSYKMDNGLGLFINGNNIFGVTPDRNEIGNSRGGAIQDGGSGAIIVNSPGVFQYSRRSAPFGFNGAFFSAGFTYDI